MRCGESSLCPVVAILAFRRWVTELSLLGRAITLPPISLNLARLKFRFDGKNTV
jgi:hypothetical protein